MSLFGLLQTALFATMALVFVPMAFLRLGAPSLLAEALRLLHADAAPLVLARGAHLPYLIVVFWFATTNRHVGFNAHHGALIFLAGAASVALSASQPREFSVWVLVGVVAALILVSSGRAKTSGAASIAVRRVDALLLAVAAIGVDRAAVVAIYETFDWSRVHMIDMDCIVVLSSVLLVALAVVLGADDERLSASAALVVLKFTRLYPRLATVLTATALRTTPVQIELASLVGAIVCFVVLCWSPAAPTPVAAPPAAKSTAKITTTTPPTTVEPEIHSPAAAASTDSGAPHSTTPPLTPGRTGAAAAFRPRVITPARINNGATLASPASGQNLFRALVTPVCSQCKSSTARTYVELEGGTFICSQCSSSPT
jgi:hypothetical protein